ncbi:MAG: hypothetical protein KDA93_21930 [Planctomycetaceae bacterium]|nr:hypothetical protein [Planctomycetaceae bacterium]
MPMRRKIMLLLQEVKITGMVKRTTKRMEKRAMKKGKLLFTMGNMTRFTSTRPLLR